MPDVQYPDITVKLLGEDGNAYHILGTVQRALREHGIPGTEISRYVTEATSGDYNRLLQVTLRWVNVTSH